MKAEEALERLQDVPEAKAKAKALSLAFHFASTPEEKQDATHAILGLYHRYFDLGDSRAGAFGGASDKDCAGELLLGEMVQPGKKRTPFHLRLGELRQHLSIFGRAGAGKTNLVYQLLRELGRNRIPFLLTDWKNDYSDLDWSSLGIGDSRPVHVLPVGRRNVRGLALNPLIPPPNVDPTTWLKRVCEVFTHAYMGGPRFEQIIRDACDHLYKEKGVYDGTVTDHPTLMEVKNYLEQFRPTGREAQWMQSVQSTLSSLCFGGTGETLNVPRQPPLDFLLRENVVLDMSALSNADKTFIIETLLLWIYYYRLGSDPSDNLQCVILLEEAHHLLRERDEDEESIVDVTLREIRSLGIGVVVIDQMPSLISKVALANSYATACLNVKLSDDADKMARCMTLEDDQKKALSNLPVGAAVFKMQDRHTRPFILQIPHVKVKRVARESVPVSIYAGRPESAQPTPESPEAPGGARIPPIPPQGKARLELELALLRDVVDRPESTVVERYARLDLSRRKGNLVRQFLAREKLVEETIIRGKGGAWVKLLQATEDGRRAINLPITTDRFGGVEHRYWVFHIAQHLKQKFADHDVHVEHPLGDGRAIDIAATKDGELAVAVEVETGKSDAAENARKCMRAGAKRVIVAFTRKAALEGTRAQLPPGVEAKLAGEIVE